jgi:hypothetical protein
MEIVNVVDGVGGGVDDDGLLFCWFVCDNYSVFGLVLEFSPLLFVRWQVNGNSFRLVGDLESTPPRPKRVVVG